MQLSPAFKNQKRLKAEIESMPVATAARPPASARANLAKAREVRTAQLAAVREAEINLTALRGNLTTINDKLESIQ